MIFFRFFGGEGFVGPTSWAEDCRQQKRLSSLLKKRRKPRLPRYHSRWHIRAHFRHQLSSLSESRLFGNGEETRFHLNPKGLSENTRGPVTSPCSALPRSNRQLSEASAERFFPCHRICSFCCCHTPYRSKLNLSSKIFPGREAFYLASVVFHTS